MADTKYSPKTYVYASRGLAARWQLDRVPEGYYVQWLNVLEREENSVSSRFGYTIVNRDPNGTVGGVNHLFAHPVVSLAKLNYQNNPQRFAGLSDGSLWQRNSNAQGPYSELVLPQTVEGVQIVLSGQPFGTITQACFETSLPFLFIYDSSASIKVAAGSSTPQLTGIDPPYYGLNTLPYAPLLTMIDNFGASNSYDTSGVTSWGWANLETLSANSGQLVTDFSQFFGIGPSGGGTTNYSPSVTSESVSATQSGAGTNIQNSAVASGFPSVVPSAGETVSLAVTWDGSISISGPYATGATSIQYSPDNGTTWINMAGGSSSASINFPTITSTISVSVSNLSSLQVRAQAIANVGTGGALVSVTTNITNIYASVSNPSAFGPVVNGMLALLNNNQQAQVPIANISSVNQVGGIYTQLEVTTTVNHNLSASDTCAVYATWNDLVDGFYPVDSVTASNSFRVPFLSVAQVGSQNGYVTYATSASNYAGSPSACVLANQYSSPYPPQISAWGFYEWVPPSTTSFPVSAWSGTISSASSTGTVSKIVTLDLSQGDQVVDADLVVLTLLVSNPENIAQASLKFYVGGTANNYYEAFISPSYFQGAISGNVLAYQATQNQILADALNLISGQPLGSTTAQLQPTNLSTGAGSWAACYVPRGNFLPVGQAGQQGYDWSSVTKWELDVTTNTNGGSSFSVNGLYLQWGYGPSSFAGIGYDWRYTYYNANTGTESSPDQEQFFNETFGYLASLSSPIFLRQAAQNIGYYSNDPQVTHVRLYRRGGIVANTWVQVSQWPNLTGGGKFYLKDVIGDQFILQAPPLVLDNDPPVTSSLVTPIQTTLSAATTGPGSSLYSTFSPQIVTVAQAGAVFVPNQIVEIGNANNLEVVSVNQGGTGQFTATLRLQHNQGEPVNVYATPRVACDLCCIANLPGGSTQVVLAGDPNNPARVYYAKPNQPETFGPQNYLDAGPADDPVMALINWRGTAFVATQATWYIFIGGAQPYLQPTGAAHGIVAKEGWTLSEGEIWYRASDGWRMFTGADGKYMTLPVEWIFRGNPECLPPQANASDYAQDVFAFFNNCIYGSYISLNGDRYRLVWDVVYQRFRQDDIAATAMLWEKDTNQLLAGVPIPSASNPVGYAVVLDQQYSQDYDDGGWSAGSLVQQPINITLQWPFNDLGSPHFPKQWNVLEADVNTQGQNLNTTLYFNTEPQTSIVLPAINSGTVRQKIQQQIEGGDGYQAYAMSIQRTMAVTVAPTLFGENVYAALLADYRSSFDTYWQKASSDRLKLWKQVYVDYSGDQAVTFYLYINGDMTHPYFVFTLPAQVDRSVVRTLFPAIKSRLWRMVGVSTGSFQLWAPISLESKQLEDGSGFSETQFGVYQ